MALHVFARIAVSAAFAAAIAGAAVADLKGDYNVEFNVQGTPYVGTFKTTPATRSAYTAKINFTTPATVLSDATGKTAGDSMTFSAKYEDTTRNCTGTFEGKGTVEKDGSKAAGVVAINDSCSGSLSGTFRLWK